MGNIQTYLPLYRRYRPQKFSDLVGQEPITHTLENAITLNQVSHAYLFCGPRGTGKTSAARIFAKSLNCEQGPTVTPCQTCASCISVTAGNAIDVIEFDAASNNSVDNARELIENCQFAPMSGRYKIYIIDEVHMLTTSAFNALLKTLEEPPANVIFIFATTEAHKVLPTIISRCQRFDFNRIRVQDIIKNLDIIATAESISISPEALAMIARQSRGGMRDALGLLDQVAILGRAQADYTIQATDITHCIGALAEDVLLNLTQAIITQDAMALLQSLTTLINQGIEPTQLIKDLTIHIRNLYIISVCGNSNIEDLLGLSTESLTKLQPQASQFSNEEYPQLLNHLAQLERTIRMTQQSQLWLEIGLVELAYRKNIYTLNDLANRLEALEKGLNKPLQQQPLSQKEPAKKPPAVAEAIKPQTPPLPAPFSTSQADPQPSSAWDAICASIASPPTRSLLSQHASLKDVQETAITLVCRSEPTLNIIKKPDKFLHLQKAVEKYFNHPMDIHIVLETEAADSSTMAFTPQPAKNETPVDTMTADPTPITTSSAPSNATPPVDDEAKRYTIELLQGKPLE